MKPSGKPSGAFDQTPVFTEMDRAKALEMQVEIAEDLLETAEYDRKASKGKLPCWRCREAIMPGEAFCRSDGAHVACPTPRQIERRRLHNRMRLEEFELYRRMDPAERGRRLGYDA